MKASNQSVSIATESIHLDQLLKWIGLTETGGQARFLIDNGDVRLNGNIEKQRRKKIKPGDIITVHEQEYWVITEENSTNAC
jgi:ribosome-associated protein